MTPIDGNPYPAYQDSGLPWIGKIPEGWEVRRNGRLFAQRNETGRIELPILEVSLHTGVRVRDFGNGERKQVMADPQKYKRAAKGDLTYNMMRMWQGAIGVSPVDGLVSPAYVVARPHSNVESRYYSYLFRTPCYLDEIDKYSRGIVKDRNRLYWEDFKRMPSLYPPMEEQSIIVQFLDFIGHKIKRCIQAKRRLITLLEEQEQAIVHLAVTKGLDPRIKLKESGIIWLGKIPESWHFFRLKTVTTRIEQGWSPQCDSQPASDSDWGVLKVGCVNKGVVDGAENKKLPENLRPICELEIKNEDILVSRANTRKLIGLAAIAIAPRPKLILCDKLFRFRANPEKVNPRFLVHSIRQATSRAQIECSTNGASDSMQNIGQDVIRNLFVSLPLVPEQNEIVKTISDQTAGIQAAIKHANHEIGLLLELRTRLITDVVLGRLDVREAVAQLSSDEKQGEFVDASDAMFGDEEVPEDAEAEEVEA